MEGFVTHADNLIVLCREGDVEPNVRLHLRAKFKKMFFEI